MISNSVWLWCFSEAILKCGIKMNCGLNKNSGIQFADQKNIIIDSNIVQIQPNVPTWHYFRFSGAILNFGVKESPDKVSIGTVEKLTIENMGIAFGILSLGGTEPEIHLGGHLRFKKYHCNTRVNARHTVLQVGISGQMLRMCWRV